MARTEKPGVNSVSIGTKKFLVLKRYFVTLREHVLVCDYFARFSSKKFAIVSTVITQFQMFLHILKQMFSSAEAYVIDFVIVARKTILKTRKFSSRNKFWQYDEGDTRQFLGEVFLLTESTGCIVSSQVPEIT